MRDWILGLIEKYGSKVSSWALNKRISQTDPNEWIKGYKKWKNEEVYGQKEQEELKASYKQSLVNKKERENK